MWIGGLPGQGFGFIQSEAKHLFGRFEGLAKLGEDGVFGLLNLSDKLSAREQADRGEGWLRGVVSGHLWNRIHD